MAALKRVPKAPPAPAVPQPPEMPNGSGRKFLEMIRPVRTVELDAGVFDYLWRICEARLVTAKAQPPGTIYEAQADMLERAVAEFRRAITREQTGVAAEAARPPVRRVITKRK